MFNALNLVISPQITVIAKSAQPGNLAPTFVVPTSTMASSLCFTCGIIKKFGKYSCCARGGTWFKKCGDEGDTTIDHTWTEGIQACKGTPCSAFLDIALCTIYFCVYHIRLLDGVTTGTTEASSPLVWSSTRIATRSRVAAGTCA